LPDYNGFGYAIISSWILGEIILRTKHNEERYKIAKEVNHRIALIVKTFDAGVQHKDCNE
jgi:hypothetical protein